MYKFYDCSINVDYPHRGMSLEPKENDVMRSLNNYCYKYDFLPTNNYKNADIIITNTTFPNDIIEHSIKNNISLVKRMDGIYWRNNEKERNMILNNSAIIANHVIFISNFAQKTFHTLYPELELKNESVVLNNVDNKIFYKKQNVDKLIWGAAATNWERSEKRFNEILKFSQICEEPINLIGKCDFQTPKNITKFGYLDNYTDMLNIYNECSAFVNMSY